MMAQVVRPIADQVALLMTALVEHATLAQVGQCIQAQVVQLMMDQEDPFIVGLAAEPTLDQVAQPMMAQAELVIPVQAVRVILAQAEPVSTVHQFADR